ncbi:hypothetical protein F4776DRAFT_673953 [Hypoxylon sp. NC0597]|nr:hypothetical protein F4776DRAFT_673953 [Hypoxylon sp. NC0597]
MDISQRVPVVELRGQPSRLVEWHIAHNSDIYYQRLFFGPSDHDPLRPPEKRPGPWVPIRWPKSVKTDGAEPSPGSKRLARQAVQKLMPIRRPMESFSLFYQLPADIRRMVWDELMPPGRVVVVWSVLAYVLQPHINTSTHIPELYKASPDTEDMITNFGIPLQFFSGGIPVHCEWYDRLRDMLFIPCIRVFDSWKGWDGVLSGATVILNVLEVTEDEIRGEEPSLIFSKLVKEGIFDGVRAFRLSMLTVRYDGDMWSDEDNVYDEDQMVAVVDLDDKRLPNLLRPVFDEVRGLHAPLTHKRPSCLLKHLHKQWDTDLKFLFEEQWLRTQIQDDYAKADPETRGDTFDNVFSHARFGYEKQHFATNREDQYVRNLISKRMPKIRPVIVFERVIHTDAPGDPRQRPSKFNRGPLVDGLQTISNRRRMSLSPSLISGRITQYL